MEVKLWQVIWLLIKQWRDWNKPVDFVGLVAGLRKFGVKKATYEQLEEIRLQEFLDSIENPTPEQVAKNIRLMVRPEVPRKPLTEEEQAEYEAERLKSLELDLAIISKRIEKKTPEELDRAFWAAAYGTHFHNPIHADKVDMQHLRQTIKKKRELLERFRNTEFLDRPEDIVPGEEPIRVQLAVPAPTEKHVLDND
jgi:hypothetical protein